MSLQLSIALIGFGEAASTFARKGKWGVGARSFDIDTARHEAMDACGVRKCSTAEEALEQADLVLSLVTADASLHAARTYAAHLKAGALWCDMNSVAPTTKKQAAKAIKDAGGRYADVAIMAPVEPAAMSVPLLVAGPDAAEAINMLGQLGFTSCYPAGDEIGRAAAIKLCRSIIVKGMEALTAEMALSAVQEGVLAEVLASLDASEKSQNWHERADYALDRMLVHGERRSAEMYEASQMIADLGISPLMSEAIVQWQEGLGLLDLETVDGLESKLAAIMAAPQFGGEQ